jgi:hypothetical protein
VEIGFWVKFLFSNYGAIIEDIENPYGVMKQRSQARVFVSHMQASRPKFAA